MVKAQKKEGLKNVNNLEQNLVDVKKSLGALEDDEAKTFYQIINTLVKEAYGISGHGVRNRNTALELKYGFVKALKNTAKDISEEEKITIKIDDNLANHRFENDLELLLYRITQELINKVVQHARAIQINITIYAENDLLNIAVNDNCRGFDPSEIRVNNAGIGLKVMQRQIENLNGEMDVYSKVGVSTTMTLKLPLNNKLAQVL